jgi:hypothetical protein
VYGYPEAQLTAMSTLASQLPWRLQRWRAIRVTFPADADYHGEGNPRLQVSFRLKVGPAGRLIAEVELDILDPVGGPS